MAATEYQLSIAPVKVTGEFCRHCDSYCIHNELFDWPELPPEEVLINQGRALIDGTSKWTKGKTFHKVVHTSARPKFKGEPSNWYCRVSEHAQEEASFDELWGKLGVNKGENEVKCVRGFSSLLQHVET